MKRVLVTGAAGFIGSHTVDFFLKKNFFVIGIDNLSTGRLSNLFHLKKNKNFKFKKVDILKLNEKSFPSDIEYVIHLAGLGDIVPSIKNPKKYFEVNVNGTLNLLSYLNLRSCKKFVYAASSSCYGIAKTPTAENHKISPQYPYALSKYLGEVISMHWHKVYGFPVNSIRIFNAYGPRSRTSGAYGAVMGIFIKQLLKKKPFTIVGNGNQKRDFLYVTDLAEAFYKAAISQHVGKIWNAGSGNSKSINYLANLLNLNKISRKIFLPKRPGEPEITFANINKIRTDLKWEPKIKFEEGIKIILKNKDYWKDAPLWNKTSIKKATKLWFKYLQK
jgi:UDP-glucose 4-epimerase